MNKYVSHKYIWWTNMLKIFHRKKRLCFYNLGKETVWFRILGLKLSVRVRAGVFYSWSVKDIASNYLSLILPQGQIIVQIPTLFLTFKMSKLADGSNVGRQITWDFTFYLRYIFWSLAIFKLYFSLFFLSTVFCSFPCTSPIVLLKNYS